jgi:Cys-Gly metallodipeptidase DUG1
MHMHMHMRFGPTRFSVIPRTAVAKVSVRFVPNQDPAKIISAIHTHIESEFAKLGSQNTISVQVESCGSWWQAEQGSSAMKMVEGAVEREWGCRPMFVREGGTMPVARVLEELLGAPAIMVPMGQASDAPHLANERMRRTNLFRGRNVIRRLLEDLWRRHGSGGEYPGGQAGCGGEGPGSLSAAEMVAAGLSSTRPVTPPLF